jgi:DNA polymerase
MEDRMPARAQFPTAQPFLPERITLPLLREHAKTCKGCDLYKNATQTVFGEGPGASARVMFVGEQPGDQEDLAGKPFVGPSGKMLDSLLEKVGIDRSEVYVTNAVKHFKWEPRGKRRIHSKPSAREVAACKPWLTAEVQCVRPDVIVALGATAAQAIFGSGFKVTQHRGQAITDTAWAPCVMASVHPSSLLRAPDAAARELARKLFEEDLRAVKKQMDALKGAGRKTRSVRGASAGKANPLTPPPGAAAREPAPHKTPRRGEARSRSASTKR